jgi:hypothetical protein
MQKAKLYLLYGFAILSLINIGLDLYFDEAYHQYYRMVGWFITGFFVAGLVVLQIRESFTNK